MRKTIVAIAFALGCGQEPPESEPLPPPPVCAATNTSQQPLYGDRTAFWDKEQVSVCWLNPDAVGAKKMAMVKDFITKGWDRHIDLDFVWYGQCTGCEDVFIEAADVRPYAVIGQKRSVPFGPGVYVVLNLDFGAWGVGCDTDQETEDACIEYQATHEFGHVLGFLHEQNRPDTPQECIGGAGEQDGSVGDFTYGAWDEESVMNYCAPATVFSPSPADIRGAIEVYGPER